MGGVSLTAGRFQRRSEAGFTLIELLVVIAIIAILASIMFPAFAQAREKARQTTCQSNLKQIGTAMMMYSQDYDELYPPGFGSASVGGNSYYANWGLSYTVANVGYVPSLLDPYVKNNGVFLCSSAPRSGMLSYLYNDFAAMQAQATFRAVTDTVLLSDSSPATGIPSTAVTPPNGVLRNNVGHHVGTDILLASGNVWEQADIDDVTRHNGGGVFLMADGHVKWFRVTLNPNTGIASKVYWGSRASGFPTGPSHDAAQNEPEPGADMKGYAATFQLN